MTRSTRPAPKSELGLVIERLVFDQAFRTALSNDPGTALGAYRLGELEVVLLAELLAEPSPPTSDGAGLAARLDRFVADGGLADLGIAAGPAASAQRAS